MQQNLISYFRSMELALCNASGGWDFELGFRFWEICGRLHHTWEDRTTLHEKNFLVSVEMCSISMIIRKLYWPRVTIALYFPKTISF
jgi:hypothetical protein